MEKDEIGYKVLLVGDGFKPLTAIELLLMRLKEKQLDSDIIVWNSNEPETRGINNSVGLSDLIIADHSNLIELIKPYEPTYLNRKERRKENKKKQHGKRKDS